jgi:glycosyltransferase involved in cell wall biosynthesis
MSLFETENRLEKTIRILVYPNITFAKDLEKDSYIQVIKKQITLLNEVRNDLWFYLILPKEVPSLVFDNVTQLYIDLPTHPPTMRAHFDTEAIKKVLPKHYDFDLLMSHLPEHTYDLKNVLFNKTQHIPKIFGYAHWFDLKDVVNWQMDSFKKNIIGLLEYDKCYLNTEHQKQLVLEQAKETFSDNTIKQLDDILTVQHLGVDKKDIVDSINPNPEKIIVFNHRPDTYKHYNEFIEVMDKLYEERKDFKVWVPLLGKSNRDYIITDKGDKQFYYNKLKTCCVGFSPKQDYGGWSVATTDGMMNGVPYIMFNDLYYIELNQRADFFTNNVVALDLLNKYLDNTEYRNEMAEQALSHIKDNLVYKDEVIKMSKYIDSLVDKLPKVGNSEKLKEITEWIRDEKSISKKNLIERLNWGVGIKFTQYRRTLLTNPNIFDTISEYPNYCWKE